MANCKCKKLLVEEIIELLRELHIAIENGNDNSDYHAELVDNLIHKITKKYLDED